MVFLLSLQVDAEEKSLANCKHALMDPIFRQGHQTDLGNSPLEFFREPFANKSPRIVLMIGAPGSGKSTWALGAQLNSSWVVLNKDQLRDSVIKKWRSENRRLQNGQIPDPQKYDHLFSPEILTEAETEFTRRLELALKSKHPVVLDNVNATYYRVPLMRAARMRGYSVEGLVFFSDGYQPLVSRVRTREKRGGLGLAPALIENRYRAMQFYSNRFKVDPNFLPSVLPLPVAPPTLFYDLPEKFKSIDEARAALVSNERHLLDQYEKENVFSRVEFVWVSDPPSN